MGKVIFSVRAIDDGRLLAGPSVVDADHFMDLAECLNSGEGTWFGIPAWATMDPA